MSACYELARGLVRGLVFPYLRIRASGLGEIPERGAVILAANHPNILDGLVLGLLCPRPLRFLVAEELFGNPVLARLLRWLGAIPVNRQGRKNGDALRAAQEALERGEALAIFPEGRTNNGLGLFPFKPGVAVLAARTGAPVVPAGLAYEPHIFPWGARVVRPGSVAITLGKALAAPAPEGQVEAFLDALREAIARQASQALGILGQEAGTGCPGRLARLAPGLVLVPLFAALSRFLAVRTVDAPLPQTIHPLRPPAA